MNSNTEIDPIEPDLPNIKQHEVPADLDEEFPEDVCGNDSTEGEGTVEQIVLDRPSWAIDSPIQETLDVWPLAGAYHLRWGTDTEGTMWVAVENEYDNCRFFQKYDEYLDSLNGKKVDEPCKTYSDE